MSNITVSNEFIRKIALENGFKLKEQLLDNMDLNPYVYDFARALIAAALDKDQIMIDNIETHNEPLRSETVSYIDQETLAYVKAAKERQREKGDD